MRFNPGIPAREQVQRMLEIYSREDQIFSVTFRRRNDKVVDGVVIARAGEIRKMNCRLGVKKGVKGALSPGQRKAEDFGSQCLTVFEMGKGGGFKRIPLDTLEEISPLAEEVSS